MLVEKAQIASEFHSDGRVNPWKTTPRKASIIFFLAVFFTFTTIAIANDIMALGRKSPLHFVIDILLSGTFAMGYAQGAFVLRQRFWKLLIPLVFLQFGLNYLLATMFPGAGEPFAMNAAGLQRLQVRLTFDGLAAITAMALGYAGFVYVLVSEGRRFAQAQAEMGRQQAVLEGELAAAREVQQLILPEARTILPGFLIESEYVPAREVGGDFFQIIRHADGSVLIVAGDVSGKGLKAGMLVALLIGAIRTVARFNPDPVVVLEELNLRLLGRSDAQATCLALTIDLDGQVMLANAGHTTPFVNGESLELEGALPLGIFAGAEFSQMRFELKEGDRLALLSDGVAEATNADGQLFGFEAVEGLMRRAGSAKEVADAARAFGQEDDISVIFVTRTAVPEAIGLIA